MASERVSEFSNRRVLLTDSLALLTDDESDRAILLWNSELTSIMVERFVFVTKEVGNTAQKKKVYERVAEELQSRTGVSVTGEQVNRSKVIFSRKIVQPSIFPLISRCDFHSRSGA